MRLILINQLKQTMVPQFVGKVYSDIQLKAIKELFGGKLVTDEEVKAIL